MLTAAIFAFFLALFGDGALLVMFLLDRGFTPYTNPKGGTR